jgi:hypothetical protein
MTPPNVHILHPTPPPFAGFLRVGHTGHHKLEALHAADRLGFIRLVFDAAHAVGQADFLRAQKAAGREIVIDLNVAETAMRGRFGSAVGKLPWGNPDRPWAPGDFGTALAFGTFGGISHYAGQRERFDLAHWRKPPNGKGGGTKARFACADSSCCTHGHEDMLENGHAHFITQRSRQLEALSKIPPSRRAENFLLRQFDPAVRSTRQASKLKFGDNGVQKLVVDAKSRLTRLRDALGALHEADGAVVPTSASPLFRGNRPGSGGMSVIQGGRP